MGQQHNKLAEFTGIKHNEHEVWGENRWKSQLWWTLKTIQSTKWYLQGSGKLQCQAIHLVDRHKGGTCDLANLTLAYKLREAEEKKTWVRHGFIDHVEGPTPWVNPMIVLPKRDRDIRMGRYGKSYWGSWVCCAWSSSNCVHNKEWLCYI